MDEKYIKMLIDLDNFEDANYLLKNHVFRPLYK